MGGSSTVGSKGGQPGVYGTLGTPAAGDIPGSRHSASSWTDSGIATPKATLNATVNGLGAAGQVWFVWGTTSTALNSTTPKTTLPASAAAQSVSAALTGLKSKTTYYFQPVASAVGGTSYGAIQSFTAN